MSKVVRAFQWQFVHFCNIICSCLSSTIKMIITVWTPSYSVAQAWTLIKRFCGLIGPKLATPGGDKYPLPSQVYRLLGTKVDLIASLREIQVLPSRIDSICSELHKKNPFVQETGKGHASEIFGKLRCIWHLSNCVSTGEMVVPTSQLKSIVLLLFGCMFCLVALSGQFSHIPYVITISDGEGTGSVAAAIWSPLAPGGVHQPRWFQLDLPPAVLLAWSDGTDLEPQRHINKIEAIVPAICLCTWSHLIRGSLWLHFIDNDGALACLVSGCSKNSSLSAVVDYTWAQILVLGCWPWFERVPSACNIVDGLSRKNFSTALANDWVRDLARLPEPLFDLTHN